MQTLPQTMESRVGEVWPEENIEMLKKLVSDGLTRQEISDKFEGIYTRNAVCGKIHRLQLKGGKQVAQVKAKPKNDPIWPPEKVEKLKELYGRGFNKPAYIASLLGVTPGAVVGKAHRLKLARVNGHFNTTVYPSTRTKIATENKDEGSSSADETSKSEMESLPIVQASKKTDENTVNIEKPVSLNLTFNELGERQCKSIENTDSKNPLYCGNYTGGKRENYCPYHKKMNSVVPRRKYK